MDESFLKKCSIITLSRDVYAWSYEREGTPGADSPVEAGKTEAA